MCFGTHSARTLRCRRAPALTIKELAGHESLMTTQRYMHLSPIATEAAIALLDRSVITTNSGEMLETEAAIAK
jgi:hypothetical protein